jgi:hypothetical protein
MAVIGVGQLSLIDLNDAIISGSAPSNPSVGTLWIDSSTSPKTLKEWNGSAWIVEGEIMDEGTGETIVDITETLGNMANDNKLDFPERQVVKDRLTEIIGYVIGDTDLMPTSATLDSSAKGGFYTVRRSALNAGISSSDAKYVAVKTKYDALKTYLDGLTPFKAWDLSDTNKNNVIDVVKSDFRTKWLEYYIAVDDLAQLTAQQLKNNVDNIAVGGTNYASNGDFAIPLDKGRWSAQYTGQTKEIVDISTETPPFKYAFHVKNTTNTHGGIFSPTLWSGTIAEALVDKEITISFWLKYQNIVQGANSWNKGRFGELVIEGETSTGTKVYSYPKVLDNANHTTGTNMTWQKYVGTIKLTLPSTAVKITKISFKHGIEGCTGEFWTTGIKIEMGNKVTDWSTNPEDIEGRIANAEFKLEDDQIMLAVESTETWINRQNEIDKKHEQLKYGLRIRYIRDYLQGNTVNSGNHWHEIKAMSGGVNRVMATVSQENPTRLASISRVTGSSASTTNPDFTADPLGNIINGEVITYVPTGVEGEPDNEYVYYTSVSNNGDLTYVTVDLGVVYDDIDYIHIWHYYADGRKYHNTKTEVSEDGVNWITVFDSAVSGEYTETPEGHVIPINLGNVTGQLSNLYAIDQRLKEAEIKLEDDQIILTVRNSQSYKDDFKGLATTTYVGDNYATKKYAEDQGADAKRYADGLIEGLDLSGFVQATELEETETGFDLKIASGGGVNLLKNSTGFTPFDPTWNWSRHSTNEVLNSAIYNNTANFTVNTGWTRDTTFTINGIPTFKYDMTGIGSNIYYSIYSNFINTTEGEKLTGSWWVYIPTAHNIDITYSVRLYIEWYDDVSRLDISTDIADLTKLDQWQRLSVTGTAPAGTTRARIRIFTNKNGTYWVGLPQMERGDKLTAWSPSLSDTDVQINELILTDDSIDVETKAVGAGWKIARGGKLVQEVSTASGVDHTLSTLAYTNSTGKGYMRIYDGEISSTTTFKEVIINPNTPFQLLDNKGNPVKLNSVLKTTGNKVTVEIGCIEGEIIFSGVMLNLGVLPLQWSHSAGEIYNTNIHMDKDGIRVSQIEDGQITNYTVMTPTKFAGYYDVDGDGRIDQTLNSVDEVFRMDKDEFVMKKAVVKEEITLKPIKMQVVNEGGYYGVAFIIDEN